MSTNQIHDNQDILPGSWSGQDLLVEDWTVAEHTFVWLPKCTQKTSLRPPSHTNQVEILKSLFPVRERLGFKMLLCITRVVPDSSAWREEGSLHDENGTSLNEIRREYNVLKEKNKPPRFELPCLRNTESEGGKSGYEKGTMNDVSPPWVRVP